MPSKYSCKRTQQAPMLQTAASYSNASSNLGVALIIVLILSNDFDMLEHKKV